MATVLAVVGVTALLGFLHSSPKSAPPNDCAVVEPLGTQWSSMQRSVSQLGNGPGETHDLLKIADQVSAMSDKIRAAASSVSAPVLRQGLNTWADGAALSAKAQRDAASAPAATTVDADTMRAAQVIYGATAALRKACPGLRQS